MKRWTAIVFLLLPAVLLGTPDTRAQQSAAGANEWVCPGHGHGRMMRQFGKGCPMWQNTNANTGEPLTLDQAGKLLQNYVLRSGNPNLKAGQTVDTGDVFRATVVTKDGSLVEELEIDKNTGWFRRASN